MTSRRLMSSSSFWSDACAHANDKPVQALLDAAYASCGMTVSVLESKTCALLLLLLLLLLPAC